MKQILVIEDDRQIVAGLRINLEAEGYKVLAAHDGETGLAEAIRSAPDAIILDLMLPRLSGLDVCRALKQRDVNVPILILSARAEETDKIIGLELGADDYVTKPFSVHELTARIRVMLRRADRNPTSDSFQFGDVDVNFRQQRVRRKRREIHLSSLEFEVLRYLVVRRSEVISRDQLLADVWGAQSFSTTRTVDTLVARLRQKLENDPHHPRHILTVHGTGYRFVA